MIFGLIIMDISNELIIIMFAFARISSFLFFIPFLSGSTLPNVAKLTIAVALSFAVVGNVEMIEVNSDLEFISVLISQLIIGFTLAKVVEIFFSIVHIAGGIMDMDMGFSASSILDPNTQQRTTAISSILNYVFLIVFIEMEGINQLIITIVMSFQLTESLAGLGHESFLTFVSAILLYMFTSAIQIALPLMGSMFILNFVMIIMGRTTPQIPILTNSFSIKISMGILFLGISFPYIVELFVTINDKLFEEYINAFNYLFTR